MICLISGFNPCFIGSMYKNCVFDLEDLGFFLRFNPCFIGSMYKNSFVNSWATAEVSCFNPCFIGSMYKNEKIQAKGQAKCQVSILVLLDLCIKTGLVYGDCFCFWVSILVLLDLCIKTKIRKHHLHLFLWFQSLFYWIYV